MILHVEVHEKVEKSEYLTAATTWTEQIILVFWLTSLLVSNTYGLLMKCEVKIAGYWPSSFLRVYGPRPSRGP